MLIYANRTQNAVRWNFKCCPSISSIYVDIATLWPSRCLMIWMAKQAAKQWAFWGWRTLHLPKVLAQQTQRSQWLTPIRYKLTSTAKNHQWLRSILSWCRFKIKVASRCIWMHWLLQLHNYFWETVQNAGHTNCCLHSDHPWEREESHKESH